MGELFGDGRSVENLLVLNCIFYAWSVIWNLELCDSVRTDTGDGDGKE